MPKLYHFTIRNDRTQETITFYGQGERLDEAFKEGVKNCGDTFRPKNDGKARQPNSCAVTLRGGRRVTRTFSEWESDIPYGGSNAVESDLPAAKERLEDLEEA